MWPAWLKRTVPVAGSAPPQRPSRVPDGLRVYAIGDIHGRFDLLQQMQALILGDAANAESRCEIVYLGDYVDRGPASREVIDLLASGPPPGFSATCLLGNHEAAMLQFLRDSSMGDAWLTYGGMPTLNSYGIPVVGPGSNAASHQLQLRQLQAAQNRNQPDAHRDFLTGLRISHSIGDYFFAHAGVRPGVPLAAQEREDLIWIRDEFLLSRRDHGQVVVHGHSITQAVEEMPNRIGIDTGAYFSNRLSCLVLEGESRRFLST